MREGVEAGSNVVAVVDPGDGALATFVVGGAIIGGLRHVGGSTLIDGTIEVVERAQNEEQTGIKGVDPSAGGEDVLLSLAIVKADGSLIGIVGHFEIVETNAAGKAKLVFFRRIVEQGSKSAAAHSLIVDIFKHRRFETPLGAVAAEAGVISKFFGVVAKAEPVIGGVVAAIAEEEFSFFVTLETVLGRDVKDSVDAVTIFGGVAACFRLQIGNIFGIELRSDIGGDVGVGNGDAIDGPSDLMSATDVKLIVDHVGAGNKLSDDFEAGAGVDAGIAIELCLIDEEVSARRVRVEFLRGSDYVHLLRC